MTWIKSRGEKYNGRKCGRCGETLRYVATRRCVTCQRRYVKLSGYTTIQRSEMVGEKCFCCSEPMFPPFYDEAPNTDQFRGWLCRKCNLGLGFFDDDSNKLQMAIEYLNGR